MHLLTQTDVRNDLSGSVNPFMTVGGSATPTLTSAYYNKWGTGGVGLLPQALGAVLLLRWRRMLFRLLLLWWRRPAKQPPELLLTQHRLIAWPDHAPVAVVVVEPEQLPDEVGWRRRQHRLSAL